MTDLSTTLLVRRLLHVSIVIVYLVCSDSSVANAQSPHKDPLYVASGKIWPSPAILVCWENLDPQFSNERNMVQQAVATSWESVSMVRFIGWSLCYSGRKGIHVRVADEGPHTKGLGTDLDGQDAGMVLNFTFNNWGCEDPQGRQTACVFPYLGYSRNDFINIIAVHEFGHALGFSHEQNRSDAPEFCSNESQGDDGDVVTSPFDMQSVMNYCNPNWGGNGQLSQWDIEGVRLFYGMIDSPFVWSYRGTIDGMACTRINEPSDSSYWRDNYLCVDDTADEMGWKWSVKNSIPGMRCTQINEPSDSSYWQDNYLCVPQTSDISFTWSYRGPIDGKICTQINDTSERSYWNDNYLCIESSTNRRFRWSYTGALSIGECIQFLEPSDRSYWKDNYLCVEGSPAITFQWSYRNPIEKMRCVQINESSDASYWQDNYLCVPEASPVRLQWSFRGAFPSVECWKIMEPSEDAYWRDNYLCLQN